MVSAWAGRSGAGRSGLVLGQVKVDAKSNEITALPVLLEMLDLTGALLRRTRWAARRPSPGRSPRGAGTMS